MWPIVWGLTRERMCTKYRDYDIQFCFCKSDRSVGERKVHGVILVMTQELKFRPFYSEITWKIAVILVCFHSNPIQCYAYIGNPLQTIWEIFLCSVFQLSWHGSVSEKRTFKRYRIFNISKILKNLAPNCGITEIPIGYQRLIDPFLISWTFRYLLDALDN